MRLHTNTLTHSDLMAAADVAGVSLVTSDQHGSRSHVRAFEVKLSGAGDAYGATWDEWGAFIAEIYRRDVTAVHTWSYDTAPVTA